MEARLWKNPSFQRAIQWYDARPARGRAELNPQEKHKTCSHPIGLNWIGWKYIYTSYFVYTYLLYCSGSVIIHILYIYASYTINNPGSKRRTFGV